MNDGNYRIDENSLPHKPFGSGSKKKWDIPLEKLSPPKDNENGKITYDRIRIPMEYEEARKKVSAIRSVCFRYKRNKDPNANFSVMIEKADKKGNIYEPEVSTPFGEDNEQWGMIIIYRTK